MRPHWRFSRSLSKIQQFNNGFGWFWLQLWKEFHYVVLFCFANIKPHIENWIVGHVEHVSYFLTGLHSNHLPICFWSMLFDFPPFLLACFRGRGELGFWSLELPKRRWKKFPWSQNVCQLTFIAFVLTADPLHGTWIHMRLHPGSLELKAKARAASPASQAGSSSTLVCLLWIRYTPVAGCTDESFHSWYNLPTQAWNGEPANATILKTFNTFCKYPKKVLACLMTLHFERIADRLCCFANIEPYSKLDRYMLNDNFSFWLTACRLRAVSAQFFPDGHTVPAQHFGVFRSWSGHCLRFCQFCVTMSNQESRVWNWLSCWRWGGSPLKCDALLSRVEETFWDLSFSKEHMPTLGTIVRCSFPWMILWQRRKQAFPDVAIPN